SFACASARCRDFSRLRESTIAPFPAGDRLVFFQRALQRMLVLPGEIHNLRHFRFGDLIGVYATNADTASMHVQHDAGRFLATLAEKACEDVHDELHRRVVVVQHQYLIHSRLLRLRLWLDDYAGAGSFLAASSVVAHTDPGRWRSPPLMILALPAVGKALSWRFALHKRGRPMRLIRCGTAGSAGILS